MTTDPTKSVPAIRTDGLVVEFPLRRRLPFRKPAVVHAVDGVSFSVRRGTTFGIVGESGSGKTTTALAIMRLQAASAGRIFLDGQDITHHHGEKLREVRKRIQIIFQDPYSSLNPRRRVGAAVREPLDLLEVGDAAARERTVSELFERVGLRPEQMMLFPHQFSGGQRQRVGIARALALSPQFVLADEIVSGLDVSTQAQILTLLEKLAEEMGLTVAFISHDLSVIRRLCRQVIVMRQGAIVEASATEALFDNPRDAYTRDLLAAIPLPEIDPGWLDTPSAPRAPA